MAELGISMIATSSREWIAYCKAAERVGLGGAWTADSFARDSFVDAALALTHTSTLQVGLGVALPTRTPLQVARAASSLGEWEGRFTLGFGVGHSDTEGAESLRFFHMVGAGAMESAHGIPFHPPIGRLRDYLDCVQGLLHAPAGEAVDIERTHFRARGKGFGFTRETLPVVLGGMGPRLCALAGERTDGLILHHVAPRALLAERVERARAAQAGAGRPGAPFRTALGLICAVDPDEGRALRLARAELTGALVLEQYLERLAFVEPELAGRVAELLAAGRPAEVAALLPEEVVRDMILVTTPARMRADAEAFREVDLVLPLPAGIFAPMVSDSLGLGGADWAAARAHLVAGVFGDALDRVG